jgi:hypothetical protein
MYPPEDKLIGNTDRFNPNLKAGMQVWVSNFINDPKSEKHSLLLL